MSASAAVLDQDQPPAAPPPEPRRRWWGGPDEDTIPIEFYGLRRGTVTAVTTFCVLFAIFTLIPIVWLVINSTKTQANIFETFGFWFASPFVFGRNFGLLFQNVDGYGIYFQWFGNTVLYAVRWRRRRHRAGRAGRLRLRPVPVPRLPGAVLPGDRGPAGADHGHHAAAVPELRQGRPDQLDLGDDPAQHGQPGRRVPDEGVRRGVGAARTASTRPGWTARASSRSSGGWPCR